MATELRNEVPTDVGRVSPPSDSPAGERRGSSPPDLEAGAKPSVSGLVTGIVNDVQSLVKQHVELLREEVKEDLQKTKQAASALGLGLGIAAVGGLLLIFMLVHLLDWVWPDLALWHAFGIVGGALVIIGGILFALGRTWFKSFNPLPDKTLKEIQWTINPK